MEGILALAELSPVALIKLFPNEKQVPIGYAQGRLSTSRNRRKDRRFHFGRDDNLNLIGDVLAKAEVGFLVERAVFGADDESFFPSLGGKKKARGAEGARRFEQELRGVGLART